MNKSIEENFPPNRSIVLIGMMASGKSAVGARLARDLGLAFRDADKIIEQEQGRSVADIFDREGEAAFRRMECNTITRLLTQEPLVLAVGGGAFVDDATRAAIKKSGAVTVWLRVDRAVLIERAMRHDHRPLLRGDPAGKMKVLLEVREPVYALADVVVDGDNSPIAVTAQKIAAALRELSQAD